MKDLKDLGNYNGLMAVVGGLSDSILDRMHKTKEFLSNEDKLVSVPWYWSLFTCRDAGAIAGQGGQQKRKGTEDHIQQIFIILFPSHVLLIFLGTDFVLIRE